MLKFVFWLLAAINLLVLAIGQGYLGSFRTETREPARLKNQLHAEKITLLTPGQATLPAEAATAATALATPATAPATAAPQMFACTEVGDFVLADARKFEARLEPLSLGERQSRRNVAGQDISSYMVFIPPQGARKAPTARPAN